MNWGEIGSRIRKQREYMGYTREQLAELIDITPKFCADIELGVKGMSIPTLCKIADVLHLSCDYILFGTIQQSVADPLVVMLSRCKNPERMYAEQILKTFIVAMNTKNNPDIT